MNRSRAALGLLSFGFLLPLLAGSAWGCSGEDPIRSRFDAGPRPDGAFACTSLEDRDCAGTVALSCEADGEFPILVTTDCASTGEICHPVHGCVTCFPDSRFCSENSVAECDSNGTGFSIVEVCDTSMGMLCRDARCQNLCEISVTDRSYLGCEFYAADLDNAAIAVGRDASAQQFAVVVSNPGSLATEVIVEVNEAAYGTPPEIVEYDRRLVPPGDLEVFELDRREVDGSSSNQTCRPDDRSCPVSEVCVCSSMDTAPPCYCRVTALATGLNDGTHTALTSRAYRIRSQFPIIAYQFNPLDNVGVFSNDASLLVPTSAVSSEYTIVGWPQTIADGDCDPAAPACANIDFDPSTDDEDLRAFLTIVGTQPGTTVELVLGPESRNYVPLPGAPQLFPGQSIFVSLEPFDVFNLESDGLNADFTGTRVLSTSPVSVFVGGEASDAPRFNDYTTRQCCADHLEEQLFGDETHGSIFNIARMPRRSTALNDAFLDPAVDSVAEVNEPEWVRVVATAPGQTYVRTSRPPPHDLFVLDQYEDVIITADQDFRMWTTEGQPLAVLQALPSQQAVGIPSEYPGGDPAIIAISPIQQYRRDYVFLTPGLYSFDFIIVTADRLSEIQLDGELIYSGEAGVVDALRCTESAADGIARMPGDLPPAQVVIRCQLSFPDVQGLPDVRVDPGLQNDGVHRILATEPVGLVVYGFDAYVSYGYAGGLNLEPLVH